MTMVRVDDDGKSWCRWRELVTTHSDMVGSEPVAEEAREAEPSLGMSLNHIYARYRCVRRGVHLSRVSLLMILC